MSDHPPELRRVVDVRSELVSGEQGLAGERIVAQCLVSHGRTLLHQAEVAAVKQATSAGPAGAVATGRR